MNTIKNYFKISGIITGVGMTLVLAAAYIISTPQAQAAQYPNIILGQDMAVGTTGQGVVVLQSLLSETGYLIIPARVPFGYYGSLTMEAVARYQNSLNVVPSNGYFGAITKSAMYSHFAVHGWLDLLGWR